MTDLIRPIVGIENRTAREVFDIMCDRIAIAIAAAPVPPAGGDDWSEMERIAEETPENGYEVDHRYIDAVLPSVIRRLILAARAQPPVGEVVAWRVRCGRKHPLVEGGEPFDWRLCETRPEIGDGAQPEWFDVQPLYAHPAEPAARGGGEYRLLTRGEVIKAGDQPLMDDAMSWGALVGWEIGLPYNPGVMVPVRRAAGGEK